VTFDVDPTAGMLAGDGGPREIPRRRATPGLIVEVASDGFAGAVVRCTDREVVLRDRRGRQRRFANTPGSFIVDDRRVVLLPSGPDVTTGRSAATSPAVTNSGSVAIDTAARVARASRILVEGRHDAELVEQVWGDDLRVEGVVVEPLHGADDLAAVVRGFAPGPGRRLGVLLDHLVDGTKESHIARAAAHPHVLITGHPFVDIWAAVKPQAVGIAGWPDIPRGRPWKEGIAEHLGSADVHEAWQRIRASVRTWHDLDRELLRAVESLIDFVTDDGETDSR
jgi:hypothetical protein